MMRLFFVFLSCVFFAHVYAQTTALPNIDVSHEANHPTHCIIDTQTLTGKQYLDAKLLKTIEAIQTDTVRAKDNTGMRLIQGGTFEMGGDIPKGMEHLTRTALPQSDELPKHPVRISSFYMDEHEVTVEAFAAFVKATGYKTVAEQDIDWGELKKQLPPGTPKPDVKMLQAGTLVFEPIDKTLTQHNMNNGWKFVAGASWHKPDGKTDALKTHPRHPVTQVSWYDAMAYAKWVGKRLPTEAEFEYAMRGGDDGAMYPWGNEQVHQGKQKGNFLQGEFPYKNTGEDGYSYTAPVKSFPANGYGLHDMSGNVWEWVSDWYGANYYQQLKETGKVTVNPQGPKRTQEIHNPHAINKVVRGGSFLCHDNWCSGFRNARRMRLSPDSGMQHVGFRLVRDVHLKH